MPRLMLLDGNGLIYRGYFALINQPLTTSRGELVTAIFGFTNIVLRAFQDVEPDHVAVAFDLPAPTFRHEAYAEYKATRQRMPDDLRDQIPKVREVVKALHIPVYEQAGYEADDAIATLVGQAEAAGLDVTILTGDLDMLQLVSERTRLLVSLRGGVSNTVTYDLARIVERYGLRPDQMLDYKALKGDPTDNIPGVPGVGEKTASTLIRDWGDLENLYAHLDDVKPERLRGPLAEAKDQVLESRELMRLVRDLPMTLDLAATQVGEYDREAVIRLFREYEFRTLIERLPPLRGERPEEAASALAELSGTVPAARGPGSSGREAGRDGGPVGAGPRPRTLVGDGLGLQLSLDFDAVARSSTASPVAASPVAAPRIDVAPGDLRGALTAAIADPGRLEPLAADGVDGLAGWLDAQSDIGVALVADDPRPMRGHPLALAVAGHDGRVVVAEGIEASEALRSLVERTGRPLVGHEVKPLVVAGLAVDRAAEVPPIAFDTQIAAYLLNAALRSQSIADVAAERLDAILPRPADVPAGVRAGLDALAALAVRPSLADALAAEQLDRLFSEIELPLIGVLARMETTGVALDGEALAILDREFGAEIARLEQEIYADVGHEFNLGSPKQLEQVLFFELDLPKGRRTKTGYSTDATVLEELRAAHPAIDKLLDWRVYTKLRSTYVEALPSLLASDGRLHTTFHQAVAATGRLSSSDPNLQNIPIRTPLGRRIRRAFVAGNPNLTLLAADYSQIELRILAHVSSDIHLKDAFARQADIHRETAARVLHKEPADVTADERSMAKMVNFGIAYGMSDFGLSSRAGISRAEAQEFISNYFATYSGISYYMLHIKETARTRGYVTTLLGRKRSIPELEARNPALRGAGERMAINMPIQGTAADIMKIAMLRVAERLRADGLRARMLLQVHDELLFEVPRDEVPRLAAMVRETMESALPLDVPLTVDVKVGDDWEGMTPLTREDAARVEVDEAPEPAGAAG
jgi:DNA polymerase-1